MVLSLSVKKRLWLLALLAVVGVGLLAPLGGGPAGAAPGDDPPEYVPDELLVQVRAGVSVERAKDLYRSHGAAVVDHPPQIRIHLIRVPAPALEKMQTALARRPEFQFVEKNRIHTTDFIPDDPSYTKQWHHPAISCPPA